MGRGHGRTPEVRDWGGRSPLGTTPDELPDAMHDIGSQFCGKPSDVAEHLATQAAFALAEHVAGVSITPELLRDADVVGGSTEIG
ncbi:DUF6461 domain-containing protein [Streptomyces sp. NPDC003483]